MSITTGRIIVRGKLLARRAIREGDEDGEEAGVAVLLAPGRRLTVPDRK
jgi:hypothetical protein